MNTRRVSLLLSRSRWRVVVSRPSPRPSDFDRRRGRLPWVRIDGNEDMYRTQIDQEEGVSSAGSPSTSSTVRDASIADHFRIDAADFGGTRTAPSGCSWAGATTTAVERVLPPVRNFSHLPTSPIPCSMTASSQASTSANRDRDIRRRRAPAAPGLRP